MISGPKAIFPKKEISAPNRVIITTSKWDYGTPRTSDPSKMGHPEPICLLPKLIYNVQFVEAAMSRSSQYGVKNEVSNKRIRLREPRSDMELELVYHFRQRAQTFEDEFI